MKQKKEPTRPEIIIEALADGDLLDSLDLHQHLRLHRGWDYPKHLTDNLLYTMCKDGRLFKSKNPMTDENVSSTQSKFIYFTEAYEG